MPEKITNFFRDKKAMVIDESEPNRVAQVRALVGLGMDHNNITSLKTMERATQIIKQRRPHIVLTEISGGIRETLKLLRDHKELFRRDRDRMTVVITSNSTEAAVAAAAEEEVDCYLVKPYSIQQLIGYVAKTAVLKQAPNPYSEKIDEGKKLLQKGDPAEALKEFLQAVGKHPEPCMAHYYAATTMMQMGLLDHAKAEFEKGLKINSLHFRCLIGYFDLLEQQFEWDKAYLVIKTLAKHFPLTPERVQQLLKISCLTLNFEDVVEYFGLFVEIEDRDPELVSAMSDGLLECGRYAIYEDNTELAVDCFSKGLSIVGRNRNYIFDIVHFLVENDLHDLAKDFLLKCDPTAQESSEFQNYLFVVDSHSFSDVQIIEAGRRLIKDGKASLETFTLTIDRLKKLNKLRALEDIVFRAIEKFPDQKGQLLKLAA